MILLRRLLIVLLLLVIPIEAEASFTMNEYQIPELIGVHSDIDKTFNITFDLKTTFSEISNVELYIEGNALPGTAVATSGLQENFELPVQFNISIADHFIRQISSTKTPIASFTSLSSKFATQVHFAPLPRGYTADWYFLKKGAGELHFSWRPGCPRGCRYITHSSVNITKAVLIVSGVRCVAGAEKDKQTEVLENPELECVSNEVTKMANEIRTLLYDAHNQGTVGEAIRSIAGRGKSIIPALIEIMHDSPDRANIGRDAIAMLGAMEDLRVVTPLIRRLNDMDWAVRDQVAYILSRLTNNNFGTDETRWMNWWSQAKPKYLARIGACIDKGSNYVEDGLPCWIRRIIAKEEMGGVANPPASLSRCLYGGQIVYYLPPRCCDIPSALWDENGKFICSPDGGFTGHGDGRCPDLYGKKDECVTIWKDSRSSR